MTKEQVNEIFAVLKMIDIKLTYEERAVATYLLKARAARKAQVAEKTVEKMNHKPLKKEAKANAN